jgi:hypothetical protein
MSRAGSAEFLRRVLGEVGGEGALGELTVHGASMHPTIGDGDRVRLVPAQPADVGVGDIVLRRVGPRLILHRVVGWWPDRRGWRLLTKGDGARRLDPPCAPDAVIGRAVARLAGHAVRPLSPRKGRALGSLAAGLCWEAVALLRRWAA